MHSGGSGSGLTGSNVTSSGAVGSGQRASETGRDLDRPATDGADVSAAELTERLMRVAHLIRRSSMSSMAALDLTPAQSRALRVISKNEQPIRMGELAATLGVVPRSATGLVDALESAGLVERSVDPANRRAVLVRLTERGRDRQRDLARARVEAGDGLFGALTAPERLMLADLLGRVSQLAEPGREAAEPGGNAAEPGSRRHGPRPG